MGISVASTEWLFHPLFLGQIGIWDSVGFCGGRKNGVHREKPSEQGREPTTNSTPSLAWESNPGHIGGRRVLSPLRHPCSRNNL